MGMNMENKRRRRKSNSHVTPIQTESTPTRKTSDVRWQSIVAIMGNFLKLARKYPRIVAVAGITVSIFVVVLMISGYFRNHIPPNVNFGTLSLGGVSYVDAEQEVITVWQYDTQITLFVGNDRLFVSPVELGIQLNPSETLQNARETNLIRLLFGNKLIPDVRFDRVQASTYLSSLSSRIDIAPQNGFFRWENDQLVAVTGTSGQQLDIEQALLDLDLTFEEVATELEFTLPINSVAPSINDPTQLTSQVERIIAAPLTIEGYDPFTDTYQQWTTTPEQLISWLSLDSDQVRVNQVNLEPFIEGINQQLETTNQYLDVDEVILTLNTTLAGNETMATVRVRNLPTTYQVVTGDTGFRIARKTGIPFFHIEGANPGRDLNILSPGDVINLPSVDVTLPVDVVSTKRIIVNLETQTLFAFENDNMIFNWQISSGIQEAPTSPGTYQILSHEPVAYGSSYTLCDDIGCGQWELNWFMGIYEVTPGLVNGFHGSVLLPNGGYLGGNNVGVPYTFGCVMSRDDQAQQIYAWAETGTVVEIISDEYAPRSALARGILNS